MYVCMCVCYLARAHAPSATQNDFFTQVMTFPYTVPSTTAYVPHSSYNAVVWAIFHFTCVIGFTLFNISTLVYTCIYSMG